VVFLSRCMTYKKRENLPKMPVWERKLKDFTSKVND
jgi:hypothetical protein